MRSLSSTLLVIVALGLGALLPRVALATPGKDACTGILQQDPVTQGATITAPGTWCLDEDLLADAIVTDGAFAMVAANADDVIVDCRGHWLVFSGSAFVSIGVGTMQGARARLQVRNCRFRGFSTAIDLNSDDYVVEDNLVEGSVANMAGDGLAINGYGSGIIRRNRIHGAIVRAIYSSGKTRVTDNLIDGVAATQEFSNAVAIELDSVDGAEVRGNTVRGLDPSSPTSQNQALQIDSGAVGGARTVVADNVFVDDGSGGDIGVSCFGLDVMVTDNVLSGFFAPTYDCSIVTDNDVSP
jgi:hypothetical protein